MGMPSVPRRRSMEDIATARHFMEARLDADDFSDVFGGPPRSVLSRKFSADSTRSSSSLYEQIFLPPTEFVSAGRTNGGSSLPAFRIPARAEGLYSDVLGLSEEGRTSRQRSRSNSKSKSNSSSVLSSEGLSPRRRPVTGDDVALSSFASKLRPINVPYRWKSNKMRPAEEQPAWRKWSMPSFSCNHTDPYYMENEYINENLRNNSYFKVSRQCDTMLEEKMEQDEDEDEDEVMSSYVIEINSNHQEGTAEAVSIDEAIAWAKEKSQSQSFGRQHENVLIDHQYSDELEERPDMHDFVGHQMDGHGSRHFMSKMETERLDEDIRLWSAGRETKIRQLLSTLHPILWANSGWYAIPLTSLVESSQVKKAYQKARLCLHPDKLQQRGATLPQKYVAEKAFSILQDAWAAFISRDLLFN
ncbi:CHAPERONE DNAJ-DOMAIN SUPERFAMILY PROTEIN [Salix purpurea]|uniref:CHAPERONE DNAJ-DOMAIN SUPERFAMILY PROTEIN n=1 Tax=Salix purpurea TaxID=77065 RepID=A0A9Q0WFJ3_SALPP|nr:CHAPERONE DNAJ-DOMAIN SUPERFAMILY PROTEIN [Salix purpurea]